VDVYVLLREEWGRHDGVCLFVQGRDETEAADVGMRG
jgi:hypothetical protein